MRLLRVGEPDPGHPAALGSDGVSRDLPGSVDDIDIAVPAPDRALQEAVLSTMSRSGNHDTMAPVSSWLAATDGTVAYPGRFKPLEPDNIIGTRTPDDGGKEIKPEPVCFRTGRHLHGAGLDEPSRVLVTA
ncbi:MAG: hypothetical protein OXU19_11605 [bacterium]|nr:hypothetical protein [bacterium]